MNKTNNTLLLISLVAVLVLSGCSMSLAGDVTPPPGYQAPVYEEPELLTGAAPQAAPNPANGAAIYAEKCQACHGNIGLGDGPDSTSLPNEVARIGAPNVANLGSPLAWYSVILQGNIERFMPPFSNSLSSEDVWDVLAYVYTFSSGPEVIASGSEVFADTCAACHGPEGASGAAPGAADLLDSERMVMLSVDDIVQKIATGSGNDEHVFSTVLDAGQIEAAAMYVRSLNFPLEGEVVAQETTPEPEEETEDAEDDAVVEDGQETEQDAGQEEDPAAEAVELDNGLGTVTGVVTNGSGGDLPEDLEVRLEVYESFELVYEDAVTTAADGSFMFEEITLDPNLIYITLVELEGVFFPSAFHMGGDTAGDTIDLPITIYDSTSDPTDLAVSRMHIFFEFTGQGTVQVIHQVTISNRGNALIAPQSETEPVLNFTLPEGASGLIFQTGSLGNPYLQTNAGFADPSPVQPGEGTYEVLFAYDLPFERTLDWQLPVDFPTDVAVFFVSGDSVDVKSDVLQPGGTEVFGEDVFQVFLADGLDADQELDLQISQPLFGGGGGVLQQDWLTIILGVFGLALAGYGAWSFFASGKEEDLIVDDRDALVDEIIALDEAFEAGELAEADYNTQRDALKSDLRDLLDEESD